MCRAGGRRCPGNGISNTKAHAAARQRLSRARRAYDKALSGDDPSKVEAAQQKLVAAESAMDAVRKAHTHENPVPKGDVTPVEPETPPSLEAQIRAAYRALAVKKQDWIRLARIHATLTSADKREIDAVLLTMMRAGTIYLAPDSNRKVLTPDDHAAAIMIGGEPKHLIAFDAEVDLDAGADPAAANAPAAPPAESAQPRNPSGPKRAQKPKRTQKKDNRRAKRTQTGDVTPTREDTPPPRRGRRWDGTPETESDMRTRILRESGYTGPIDQDGYPVSQGRAVEILRALATARGDAPTAASEATPVGPGDRETSADDDRASRSSDAAPGEGAGDDRPGAERDERREGAGPGKGKPRGRVRSGPGGMHMVNVAHAGSVVGIQTDVNYGNVVIGPDGLTVKTHTAHSPQAAQVAHQAAEQAQRDAERATRRAQRALDRAERAARRAERRADTDEDTATEGGQTMTNVVDDDGTVVIQTGWQFGDIHFGSGTRRKGRDT